MEPSVIESLGVEVIGVMSPVSICMFLVVLLVYTLSPSSPSPSQNPIRTAANLVYLETPSDSTTDKLEGALLNAAVFVVLIALVTFLLVLLYYYNCTSFLKYYMQFSAFFVFGSMGGSIFLTIIQHFSIPVDSITCFVLLFNFTVVGAVSVFSRGIPIVVRQGYMVLLGIIVATWFTKLPEWTTWVLLVALAVYDLVAVLAPGGPLKLLVELASSRNEDLPALIYEARPTVTSNLGGRGGALGILVTGVNGDTGSGAVELQSLMPSRNGEMREGSSGYSNARVGSLRGDEIEEGETSPLVANSGQRPSNGTSEYARVEAGLARGRNVGNEDPEIVQVASPLAEVMGLGREAEMSRENGSGGGHEMHMETAAGIKLGLGDFVFYSVLVGRAAMYDLMTVYACYLAIISGLGCTLILLSVYRHALPALPISIALGVMFYFLTRLLMEPFVVGTSTNLLMF